MSNEIALVKRNTDGLASLGAVPSSVDQMGGTSGKLGELAAMIRRKEMLGENFAPVMPASDLDAAIILDWLRTGKKANSSKSQREYLRDLCGPKTGFLMFVGSKPLSRVSRDDVRDFADALESVEIPATDRRPAHGLAIPTRRRMLAAVKGLFTHANGMGLLPFNPGKGQTLPTLPESKRDKAMTRGQSLTLQAAADVRADGETHQVTRRRDALLSQMLYLTGGRISEILGLTWADIYATDKGAELKITHGKGNKERVIRLPVDVYADLLTMKTANAASNDSPVFVSQKGGSLSAAQAWRVVKGLAKTAKIDRHVSPHTMRHSIATQLLDGGAPLHQVSEFLGHSDPRVTIKSYYSQSSALDVTDYLK